MLRAEEDLRGWVGDFPRSGPGGCRFSFVTIRQGRQIILPLRALRFDLGYGDSLLVHGALLGAPRRGSPWARAREGAVRRLPGGGGSWIKRKLFWPLHSWIAGKIARNLGSRSGLSLALVLGDRGNLPRGLIDAYRRLGVSHLLALSGLHLGILFALVLFIARPLGSRARLLALAAASLYVFTARDLPSLHRAYAMLLLVLAGRESGRPLQADRCLAAAGLVLLLVDPAALYELSLRLSFAATLGVIVAFKLSAGWPRAARRYLTPLLVGACAQLFVAPWCWNDSGG